MVIRVSGFCVVGVKGGGFWVGGSLVWLGCVFFSEWPGFLTGIGSEYCFTHEKQKSLLF